MNRLNDIDRYGNPVNGDPSQNQTDTLYTPVGLGASDIQRDDSWIQNAYDENGFLNTGDWAGDVGDSNNAMDDLLSSENFSNGRIPDIRMVENVAVTVDNDVVIRNDTQQLSVKGIVEENDLSNLFFSEMNTDGIQQSIRYYVNQLTNRVISYQSSQELFIVMRSILLQHANFKVSNAGLLDEIRKLNRMVIDYSVQEVSSNVQQYDNYIRDVNYYPTPMDYPSYSGGSDNNTYDLTPHIGVDRG